MSTGQSIHQDSVKKCLPAAHVVKSDLPAGTFFSQKNIACGAFFLTKKFCL